MNKKTLMEFGLRALREQTPPIPKIRKELTIQDNDPYGVSTSDMPIDLMYFGPTPKIRPNPPRSYKGSTTGPQTGTTPARATKPVNTLVWKARRANII